MKNQNRVPAKRRAKNAKNQSETARGKREKHPEQPRSSHFICITGKIDPLKELKAALQKLGASAVNCFEILPCPGNEVEPGGGYLYFDPVGPVEIVTHGRRSYYCSVVNVPNKLAAKVAICARWSGESFQSYCLKIIASLAENDASDIEHVANGKDIMLRLTAKQKRSAKVLLRELQALETRKGAA